MLATFSVGFFAITSAHAATYYVATTGSDSNPGSDGAPFKNVQKAVGVVRAGDTVIIKPGKYAPFDLKNINGAEGAQITFQGEQGSIIDRNLGGENRYRNIEFYGVNSYITIDGLELIDSAPPVYRAKTCEEPNTATGRNGIKINKGSNGELSHHIVVKNLHVHGLEGHPILGAVNYLQLLNNYFHDCRGYGTYLTGRYMVIRGNRIHNMSAHGMRFANEGLDKLLNDSVIENNIAYNNGGTWPFRSGVPGAPCRMVTGGDGIVLWHGAGNIIRNNIFYGHVGYGIRVNEDHSLSKTPNVVYNNTVYKNGSDGIYTTSGNGRPGKTSIIKNNISYGNVEGQIENTGPGVVLSNNLTTDPQFVNPGAGDFGLQASSPAIDKGVTLAEVTTDFAGKARPEAAAYDIGAFEGAGSKAGVLPGVGAGLPAGWGAGGAGSGGGLGLGNCYK
mgnify:CR=1 FL=1